MSRSAEHGSCENSGAKNEVGSCCKLKSVLVPFSRNHKFPEPIICWFRDIAVTIAYSSVLRRVNNSVNHFAWLPWQSVNARYRG